MIFSLRSLGGQAFAKIDLSNAFNQLKVDESSSKYLTINTTKGLFQPTRLPYGIKTAALVFQNVMDQVLHGIPGVCCYIDDILITANSESEHLQRLVRTSTEAKWFEVVPMKSTTASRTVEELRKLFAQHGLPEELVSDNGPQFIASEFEEFMRSNGVKHTKCAPYHPASNGQVERLVQILTTVLHKHTLDKSGMSQSQRLQSFLLTYRTTPHATTG